MANITLPQRLTHYFLAMGAQELKPNDPQHNTISFTLGDETIQVVALSNEDMLEGNTILRNILQIASLRKPGTLLYLAVPKLLATTLDAEIFRSYGIGLITFDDRRIEETVTPRSTSAPPQLQVPPAADPNLLSELTALRSSYAQMESSLEQLWLQVGALSHTDHPTIQMPSHTELELIEAPEPATIYPPQPDGQLPSFFNNNPWLDVLSKRSRMELSPIAG